MISVLLTGLIIGLTSNLHCIGMCGPLTLIIPVNRKNKFTIFFGVLIYNIGRILTYSILGLIVGLIGVSINLFISIQVISIILGMLMLLFAWSPFFKELFFLEQFSNKIGLFISTSFSKLNQNKTSFSTILTNDNPEQTPKNLKDTIKAKINRRNLSAAPFYLNGKNTC